MIDHAPHVRERESSPRSSIPQPPTHATLLYTPHTCARFCCRRRFSIRSQAAMGSSRVSSLLPFGCPRCCLEGAPDAAAAPSFRAPAWDDDSSGTTAEAATCCCPSFSSSRRRFLFCFVAWSDDPIGWLAGWLAPLLPVDVVGVDVVMRRLLIRIGVGHIFRIQRSNQNPTKMIM